MANQLELSRALESWMVEEPVRREAGDRARALVSSGLGAAERSFALVNRLLG